MHLKMKNCQSTCIDNLKKDIKNNCFDSSGKKLNGYISKWKKKWFVVHDLIELYDNIIDRIEWIPDDNIPEKIYCILNDIDNSPCCYCKKPLQFENFSRGYRQYCSVKCRANSKTWLQNVKKTCQEKYGTDHVRQVKKYNDAVKLKLKETSYFATIDDKTRNELNLKVKKTKLQRYGNQNTGWNDKAIKTRLINGTMVPRELRPEYMLYKQAVVKFTKLTIKHYGHLIKNIEKRDNHATNKDAYHIDHEVSLYDGFTNGIPPCIIGSLCNLRCIPYKENLKKQKKSCKSMTQLLDEYYENDAKI